MQETIAAYLRRRYRWALAGIVGGAIGALLTGSSLGAGTEGLIFQGACAVVWGGSVLVAARTRCPRCRARLAGRLEQVLPVMVQFAVGTPPKRCPHCGVHFREPGP